MYFEVYNLTPNERGVTAFETTYTITQVGRTNVQKVLSIFGSGERRETSVTIERLGETPMSAEYVALDLRKAGRGTFLLEMAVLDRNSGEEASETVEIELR